MASVPVLKTVTLSSAQMFEVQTAMDEHVKFLEEGVRIYSRPGSQIDGRQKMLTHYQERLLATNAARELLRTAALSEGLKT